MDFLFALIPAICWGNIGFVSGKLGGSSKQQTLGMVIGAAIFSVIITVFNFNTFATTTQTSVWIFGILSGIFWSIGQALQFKALKLLGIAVGFPLSTGFQLIINFLVSAFIFHEIKTFPQLMFGISAMISLISGSILISYKEKTVQQNEINEQCAVENKETTNFKQGIIVLLISSLGFLGYTTFITFSKADAQKLLLPQTLGMIIGTASFSLRKCNITKEMWKNILTGLVWGIGNICMMISLKKLGLAISFSLSQTGIVFSVFGAIVFLNEKKTKKEMICIISATLLIILGGIFIGLMK